MSTNASARVNRKDPPKRPKNLASGWADVRNKDPSMTYIWVNKGLQEYGPSYYQSLGYQAVVASKDGPTVSGEFAPGKQIELRGHLLMAIDKETWEGLQYYGHDGNSGQALADKIDEKLIKDRTRRDLFRGVHGFQGIHMVDPEPSDYLGG